MHNRFLIILMMVSFSSLAQAPSRESYDSLRKEILRLKSDVYNIQINLSASHQKFKVGIVAATIGYSVTIAGGLMLGRENDDLGQVFLVAGGVTGITGTILMVDAFKYLDRAGRKSRSD